jgi:hypothetical protein
VNRNQHVGHLYGSPAAREFFVWVDPRDAIVRNNVGMVGALHQAAPKTEDLAPEHLMFVFNPGHKQGFISRFHLGVINHYRIEYDLERYRFAEFQHLPSRLHALFLFASAQDAIKYRETHPEHVRSRILKRGIAEGACICSSHDSAWIDFLRLGHSLDADTFSSCARAYWRGLRADQCELKSMGQSWEATSAPEVLFYGQLRFPNKDLSGSDIEPPKAPRTRRDRATRSAQR